MFSFAHSALAFQASTELGRTSLLTWTNNSNNNNNNMIEEGCYVLADFRKELEAELRCLESTWVLNENEKTRR